MTSRTETGTTAWLGQLGKVLRTGKSVAPRGEATLELRNALVEYDARNPVVCVPDRRLSMKFLSAEPLWILSGSDRLEDIAPYNPRMKAYSDDGKVLAGAYGPPIARQVDQVVASLIEDPSSRQAVLTIWHENPPSSKDLPCTVAMAFAVRDGAISSTVFMRSSDVWLGLPYDMLTFAAVLYRVASEVAEFGPPVRLGTVAVMAASSHLYEKDREAASAIVEMKHGDPGWDELIARSTDQIERTEIPATVYGRRNYAAFVGELVRARDARFLPAFSLLS